MAVAGVDLEVGRVVGVARVGAPVEVAQIGCLGQQLLLAVEVQSKVLRFKSMRVVDVPADLVLHN